MSSTARFTPNQQTQLAAQALQVVNTVQSAKTPKQLAIGAIIELLDSPVYDAYLSLYLSTTSSIPLGSYRHLDLFYDQPNNVLMQYQAPLGDSQVTNYAYGNTGIEVIGADQIDDDTVLWKPTSTHSTRFTATIDGLAPTVTMSVDAPAGCYLTLALRSTTFSGIKSYDVITNGTSYRVDATQPDTWAVLRNVPAGSTVAVQPTSPEDVQAGDVFYLAPMWVTSRLVDSNKDDAFEYTTYNPGWNQVDTDTSQSLMDQVGTTFTSNSVCTINYGVAVPLGGHDGDLWVNAISTPELMLYVQGEFHSSTQPDTLPIFHVSVPDVDLSALESEMESNTAAINAAQTQLDQAQSDLDAAKHDLYEPGGTVDLVKTTLTGEITSGDTATLQSAAADAQDKATAAQDAATSAAAADAQAKADAAQAAATAAAATDAQNKADAAQQAAVDAANAYAEAQANGASADALAQAKADAQTKADAAQAAATAAAAADATAKADAAQAAATQAAAADATAKADAAKQAAIDALSPALSQAQTSADNAMSAAQQAQATADGAINTYYQENAPWADGSTQPSTVLGDMWYKSSTNQAYRWDGSAWQLIADTSITAAMQAAQQAQATADGKITAYYQTTQPTTGDLNDLWYDTDDGNKPYYCSKLSPLTWTAIQDASIATAQAAATAAANEAQSRGADLVTNGTGYLKTNRNFSTQTYVGNDAPPGCVGSFTQTVANATLFSDDLIPVDPGKRYVISGWARELTGVTGGQFYIGIAPYDAGGSIISPPMYAYRSITDTTLAADLKPGDTTVQLTSGANWSAVSPNNYLIVWNYTDARGRTWPKGTYSRMSYILASNGVSGNTVTLNVPWALSNGTVPAGTPVSNACAGGSYMYTTASNAVATSTWTRYASPIVGDLHDGSSGAAATTKFPQGTANIKYLILANRTKAGVQQAFGGLSISEAAAAQATADVATATATGKNSITWSTSDAPSAANGAAGTKSGDIWWKYQIVSNKTTILASWQSDGTKWNSTAISETYLPQVNIGDGTYGELDGLRLKAKSVQANTILVEGSVNSTVIADGAITSTKIVVNDIAAAVATVMQLSVDHLVVTGGANFASAVVDKLWANIFTAYKITADQINANSIASAVGQFVKVKAENIEAGSLDVELGVTAGGTVSSEDYAPGTSGWSINGDGTVEFNNGAFRGELTAQAISSTSVGDSSFTNGSINGSTIKSTQITFDSDGGNMLCYTSGRSTTTYSTSTTVTIPAGVTQIVAECWGAGGGGHNNSGAGGGGGEYAAEPLLDVTPGETLTILVSGAAPAQQDGGATVIVRNGTPIVQANGGKAGGARSAAGGSGSTNTVHFKGGGSTTVTTGAGSGGGGGGGSAGPSANGRPGGPNGQNSGTTDKDSGGIGGAAVAGGGAGGDGGFYASHIAAKGGSLGGGGGGGYYGGTGGTGGRGQARITFISDKALAVSVSPTAGTDSMGNHYPAGISTSELNVAHTTTTPFTPGLSGGGSASINSATGYYYCLGDLVFVNCQLSFSTAGSGTSALMLTGMPFPIDRTVRQFLVGHAESTAGSANGSIEALAFTGGSGSTFDRIRTSAGSNMTGANIIASTLLSFTGWYKRA